MPELKSFLKDYEAESYRGVTVEFIHGRKAMMTVFKDGVLDETITLSDYKTKEEMHALFREKGFEKMSEEEIAVMIEGKKKAEDEEHERKLKEQQERRKQAEERRRKMRETESAQPKARDATEETRNKHQERIKKMREETQARLEKLSEEKQTDEL